MQYGLYQILTPEGADEARTLLNTQEWKKGQARTEELSNSVKRNKELKPGQDGDIVTALSGKLNKAVMEHPEITFDCLIKKMTGFKFNKYEESEEGAYYRHTDAPWMGQCRTDFTMVLALTDPDDYEGGDHYVDHPHHGILHFRPKKGELMLYETGWAHWVTPVTKGERVSALAWAETQIQDSTKRGIVKTCRGLSRDFEAKMDYSNDDCPYRKWFVDVGVIHSALCRDWADRI